MLIELTDITKTYRGVVALRGLSVALPEGAIGLLGPNGAGKTTLIRTLLGLIGLDSGTGRVLGMDIRSDKLDIRQAVGFVPEDECLFPGVTGIGFVAYAGELVGMRSADAMQRAHEMLDYVGLGEARYRQVESYSSGMKQRIKIAAAIVHDPKLLILDEPTNGMDPSGRDDVLELSRDLSRNKGMSLIFSSHLLPDVESVCEYIVVLGAGRVLAEGKLADLRRPHSRQFEIRVKGDQARFADRLAARGLATTRTGDGLLVELSDGQGPSTLWRAAAEDGEQIRSLRPRRSTLEEVFLNAVGEDH